MTGVQTCALPISNEFLFSPANYGRLKHCELEYSFLPNKVNCFIDQKFLNGLLKSKLASLIESAKLEVLESKMVALSAAVNNSNVDMNPDLFRIYSIVNERLSFDGALDKCLDNLIERAIYPEVSSESNTLDFCEVKISIEHSPDIASWALREASLVAASISNDVPILTLVIPEDHHKSKLSQALSVISETWPEMAEEISLCIQRIGIFRGDTAIGWAEFNSHGEIYLREDHLTEQSAEKLAEDIIHESSHVRLNALFSRKIVVLNDMTAKYSSPLRRDKRPMAGVFHQMYVLARLDEFYRRLKGQAVHGDVAKKIRHSFIEAVEIVKDHGQLTNEGMSILNSCNVRARALL